MRTEYVYGGLGSIGLGIIYFVIIAASQSLNHALENLLQMWYVFFPLMVGFGIQIGLFTYLKKANRNATCFTAVGGSAGISTSSMVACCAHHLSEVLPIIGFSAATLFLAKYQTSFLLLGLFSNFIGILIMLKEIQKHRLYNKHHPVWQRVFMLNMKRAAYLIGVLGIAVVGWTTYSAW